MVEYFGILEAVVGLLIAGHKQLTRKKEDVVADLKFIRFDDDGVIELIRALVEGKSTSKPKLLSRLAEFNDQEWNVRRAVQRLSEDVKEVKGVSRLSSKQIEQIGWAKVSVRSAAQQEINMLGQKDFEARLPSLRSVLTRIEKLNQQIDSAEHVLLHGG